MTTPKILQLQNLGEKLSSLNGMGAKRLTDEKLSAVSVLRVCEGAKVHIISQIPTKKLVVCSDSLGAKSLFRKLKGWGIKVDYLPYRDDVLIARKSFSSQNVRERTCTLSDMACGDFDVVVTSADSLLQLFPKKELVKEFSVTVAKEDLISPQALADRLALAGYKRQTMIADAGDFAVRGDIVDVYSTNGTAYRINFFDELVEDIKVIDVETMLSSNDVESVRFAPASDVILSEKDYDDAREKLDFYRDVKYAAEAKERLSVGACDPSLVWALPFMQGAIAPIFDYLDKTDVIVFDEPKVVCDKLQILIKEFDGRIKNLLEGGEILACHKDVYITLSEIRRRLMFVRKLSFCALSLNNQLFEPKYIIEPKTKPVTKYYLDPQTIVQDLRTFVLNGTKTLLACGSKERAKSVIESLRENDVYATYSEDGNDDGTILATPMAVETGFIYPAQKVCPNVSANTAPKTDFRIQKSKRSHPLQAITSCTEFTASDFAKVRRFSKRAILKKNI